MSINYKPKPKPCVVCKTSRALFGGPDKQPKYCKQHKSNDMIYCKTRNKCVVCNKHASYGVPGGQPRRYCKQHKSNDMIYSITSRQCVVCNKQASYGTPGNKRDECRQHRTPGTIGNCNGTCKVYGCKKKALYGSNMIRKRCEVHFHETDYCYAEHKCSRCNLMYILNDKSLCEYCDPTSQTFVIKHLYDQRMLMEYLDNRSDLLRGISTDKMVDNGDCGKERPDRLFETYTFMLILECDENQHKSRTESCEISRMQNISQMFGGLPTYFIRWNPDEYVTDDNKYSNVSIIERYKCVGDLITEILSHSYELPTGGLCFAYYMYYDGWKGSEQEKWKCILPFNLVYTK